MFGVDDDSDALRQFHFNFPQLESVVMSRMQFLDSSHLLIKFGHVDTVNLRVRARLSFQREQLNHARGLMDGRPHAARLLTGRAQKRRRHKRSSS